MLERFTSEARRIVTGAQVEARRLNHGWIGTEHLLLALLAQDTRGSAVLARFGLTHDSVSETLRGYGREDLDAEALTTLGIDLDAVRERVEATFGPGALDKTGCRGRVPSGHIPFSPRAKKVLELSLREAVARKSRSIEEIDVLLGLLRMDDGMARKVLARRGIDAVELRRQLSAELTA